MRYAETAGAVDQIKEQMKYMKWNEIQIPIRLGQMSVCIGRCKQRMDIYEIHEMIFSEYIL